MSITNNTIINVLNYMPIKIIASTSVQDYVFEPCMTDTPIILPMNAVEIKEVHSKSKLFSDGWLVFEDDIKQDVYDFLKIKDSQNILNQLELMERIRSGSREDVEMLINIKSKGYFERVYGIYVALKQSNMYDISMRVAKAIEHRYKELQNNIINTQIKLSDSFKTDDRDKIIAEQKAMLEEKDKQLNAMTESFEEKFALLTAKLEEMANNQNDNSVSKEKENETPTETKNQARRGRPPKASK